MTRAGHRKKRSKKRNIALLLLAAFLVCALYTDLTVRRETVASGKLFAGQSFCIVLVSDLHSHAFHKGLEKLLRAIDEAQPDMVALTGDIVDNVAKKEGALALLAGLQARGYPFDLVLNGHAHGGQVRVQGATENEEGAI